MSLSCTVSEILLLIFPNLKRPRDPERILSEEIYHACTFTFLHQTARNLKCIASTIKKMIGGKIKKNWLRYHDHAHCAVVGLCYLTLYILLVYNIWRLSLQPFRRCDCGRRNWKCVMWPWPRPILGVRGLTSES